MLRSLVDSWKLNLAVALAAAVATAVFIGALLVGASLEDSLAGLATERLGRIDHALVAGSFFREDLAAEIAGSDGDNSEIAPLLALVGSARQPDTGLRSSSVSIWGIDARFEALFDSQQLALDRPEGQFFPSVVLNRTLADELGAQEGDAVLLSFPSASATPAESLVAEEETIESLRVVVRQIVADQNIGRFGLAPTQELVHNAFVNLATLQEKLGRRRRVNALVAAGQDLTAETLDHVLTQHWSFRDVGLETKRIAAGLSIESKEFILRPALEKAVLEAATELGLATQPVLTYLANRITHDQRVLPYSTVAALGLPADATFGAWKIEAGEPGPTTTGVVLNRWAADDLAVEVGQPVTMAYFEVGPRGELVETQREFQVSAIVETVGLGADGSLTPDFPGIAEADSISDWDPPFPVDLQLIGPRDEEYWDLYRGAPKAFVELAQGQELWRSRFGATTSIRLAVPAATLDTPTTEELKTLQGEVERATLAALEPGELGLSFESVRARALAGAGGSTDFPGLFLAFSFFLILSAALLVVLLFRLVVQQKASQIGLRLAVGYPVRSVRRWLLREGAVLAAVGSLLGVALGILYAAWLLELLKGWWKPLLEASFLELSVPVRQLAIGVAASAVIVTLVMVNELRKLRKLAIPQLLQGTVDPPPRRRVGPRLPWIGMALLGLAIGLSAVALRGDSDQASGWFFAIGAAFLTSGFAFFSWWCRRPTTRTLGRPFVLWGLATRNSARNATRSLLSVILVGVASFILVSVGANRHAPDPRASEDLESGTGGYTLLAQSEIPLARDLADREALFDLGLGDDDAEQLRASQPQQLRLLPGDDASCLNLYRPEKPRVLGVPRPFVQRGGFTFHSAQSEIDNPWQLLDQDLGDGVIPAIGDYNSVRWILQSSLGGEISIGRQGAAPVRLRIVGLLNRSLFQSELLISEERFLEAFPTETGFSYFLFEGPFEQTGELSRVLEENLSDWGFDASRTADKLAAYEAVEGMYIATFQVLGGLGLLLGTLGLGIVVVRSIIERQGELATLRAFGYPKAKLARMVVLENSFLLLVGISIGTLAGLLAVAPNLMHSVDEVPWGGIAATLSGVFVVGLSASIVGVMALLRTPLIPVLKAE